MGIIVYSKPKNIDIFTDIWPLLLCLACEVFWKSNTHYLNYYDTVTSQNRGYH